MALDVAQLAIKADSSQVSKAVIALDKLVTKAEQVDDKIKRLGDTLRSLPNPKVDIEVNTNSLENATAEIANIKDKTIGIDFNIDDSAIKDVNNEIAKIKDKSVNIDIKVNQEKIDSVISDRTILVNLKLNSASLQKVRAELESLGLSSNTEFKIKINVATSTNGLVSGIAKIQNIEKQLDSIKSKEYNVDYKINSKVIVSIDDSQLDKLNNIDIDRLETINTNIKIKVDIVVNDDQLDKLSILDQLKQRYNIKINIDVDDSALGIIARLDRIAHPYTIPVNIDVAGIGSVDRATEALNRFNSSSAQTSGATANLSGAFSALATGGILALTNTFYENTKELQRNIDLYNISAERMQTYQQAADSIVRGGLDVADMFKDIADKMGDLIATGGGEAKNVFDRLGLSVDEFRNKNPVETLEAIIEKMDVLGNVSKQERIYLLEALANDSSKLLPLLENNTAALDAFYESANRNYTIINSEQLDMLRVANTAITDVKQSVKGLGIQLGIASTEFLSTLATPLSDGFRSLSGWLQDAENRTQAVNVALGALGAVAVPVFIAIGGAIASATVALVAFALTPIGALVTGLSLVTGGLIAARNETITLGGHTATVTNYMIATYQVVKERIAAIIEPIINIIDFLGMLDNKTKDTGARFDWLGNIIANMGTLAGLTFDQMSLIVGHFVNVASAKFEIFKLQAYSKVIAIKGYFASVFADINLIIASAMSKASSAMSVVIAKAGEVASAVGATEKADELYAKSVKLRVSGYAKIEKAKRNVSRVKLSNRAEITANIANIRQYEATIKQSANTTVKAVIDIDKQIADIVKNGSGSKSFFGDIGERAENLQFVQDFKKEVAELGESVGGVAKLNEGIKAFSPPTEKAKAKAKELNKELDKQKQAIDNLVKSYADQEEQARLALIQEREGELAKVKAEIATKNLGSAIEANIISMASSTIKMKDELQAIKDSKKAAADKAKAIADLTATYDQNNEKARLALIQEKEGTLARIQAELSTKKLGDAVEQGLLKTARSTLAMEDELDKLKETKKAAADKAKAIKDLVAGYDKQLESAKLALIQERDGTLARIQAELSAKKLNETVKQGIINTVVKTDKLKQELKALKATKEETKKKAKEIKKLIDYGKKELANARLKLIELKKGTLARKDEELKIKKVDKATREKILTDLKEIEALEEKIKLYKAYTDKVSSLEKVIASNNILINEGTEALKLHDYAIKYGNESRAQEIISREKIIAIQERQIKQTELYGDIVSDVIKGNIDSWSDLGDALIAVFDNGKLDRSIDSFSKKLVSVLQTGDMSGLGDSLLNIWQPSEGVGTLGGAFESFSTGAGVAKAFGASQAEQIGAGIGSAMGTAALGSLGGAIGSVTGATWGKLIGGLFEKADVKAQFGNTASPTEYNDWRSGWYNSSKRAQGVDFTRTSDFGQFGLLGDGASVSIGRDDKEQIANITKSLDAVEQLDNAIAYLLEPKDIDKVKSELDGFKGDALDFPQLIADRFNVVVDALPDQLGKLLGDGAYDIEQLGLEIEKLVLVNDKAVPAVKRLGLSLGNELDYINTLSNTNHLVELAGGVDNFISQINDFDKQFSTKTLSSSEYLITSMTDLNSQLGLSGDNAITTSDELYNLAMGLDLNTASNREYFNALVSTSNAMGSITSTVDQAVPLFYGLSNGLGSTRIEITESILKLADMSGGVQQLTNNLSNFYNKFYSEDERSDLALAQSAINVKKFTDSLDDTNKKLLKSEGYRKYIEGIDKQTDAGKLAFVTALEVASSMSAIDESGQSVDDILESMDSGMLSLANATAIGAGGVDTTSDRLAVLNTKAIEASGGIDALNKSLSSLLTDQANTPQIARGLTTPDDLVVADTPIQAIATPPNQDLEETNALLKEIINQNDEAAQQLATVETNKAIKYDQTQYTVEKLVRT